MHDLRIDPLAGSLNRTLGKGSYSKRVKEVVGIRAMVFDRYGEPDIMHLKDVPVPEPQDGEVLIRVGYSGRFSQ
jgi:hypothetical protein